MEPRLTLADYADAVKREAAATQAALEAMLTAQAAHAAAAAKHHEAREQIKAFIAKQTGVKL